MNFIYPSTRSIFIHVDFETLGMPPRGSLIWVSRFDPTVGTQNRFFFLIYAKFHDFNGI